LILFEVFHYYLSEYFGNGDQKTAYDESRQKSGLKNKIKTRSWQLKLPKIGLVGRVKIAKKFKLEAEHRSLLLQDRG
jgi:hypothetical protein